MDAMTCLKKLEEVGTLAFATVDASGAPQVRNISAIHYEHNGFYFFTARGKSFCEQLLRDGRVQVLALTKDYEMIRLSGKATVMAQEKQQASIQTIFAQHKSLSEVYPKDTRKIGIIFEVRDATIEYFNLSGHPIFRDHYTLGSAIPLQKGYHITDACIACGACVKVCPQACIDVGAPYHIVQAHCLHCGACYEACPVHAVEKR